MGLAGAACGAAGSGSYERSPAFGVLCASRCDGNATCKGFCFQSEETEPTAELKMCYTKSNLHFDARDCGSRIVGVRVRVRVRVWGGVRGRGGIWGL